MFSLDLTLLLVGTMSQNKILFLLFKLKTGKMSTLTEHELIASIFKSGYPGRPASGHSG